MDNRLLIEVELDFVKCGFKITNEILPLPYSMQVVIKSSKSNMNIFASVNDSTVNVISNQEWLGIS